MQCWLEDLAIDTGLSNTQHQRNAKSTPVRYCPACHSDCVSTVGILVCLCSLSGWWVQLHKEHFCLTQSNSWDIIPDNYFKLLKLSQFFCPPLNLNFIIWFGFQKKNCRLQKRLFWCNVDIWKHSIFLLRIKSSSQLVMKFLLLLSDPII